MFGRRRGTVEHVERGPARYWSPAQGVALVIGIASLVLGAWAIGRTGLNTDHMFQPHKTVATLHHTPVLALSEIGFGAMMLLAATRPVLGRGLMALLSLAAGGLGVVTVADWWHGRLHHWLGVHDRNGWLFIIVGGVGLCAALFLPTIRTRRKTVVREVPREVPVTADGRREEAGRVDDTETVNDEARPAARSDGETTGGRRHWWRRRTREDRRVGTSVGE